LYNYTENTNPQKQGGRVSTFMENVIRRLHPQQGRKRSAMAPKMQRLSNVRYIEEKHIRM